MTINAGGSDNVEKKADGINQPLELHKSLSQKFLKDLLAPAANMLGTSQLSVGCIKRQHAVILE